MCLNLQYIIENTFWITQYIFLYLLNNNKKKNDKIKPRQRKQMLATDPRVTYNLKQQMFPSSRSSKVCDTYINL